MQWVCVYVCVCTHLMTIFTAWLDLKMKSTNQLPTHPKSNKKNRELCEMRWKLDWLIVSIIELIFFANKAHVGIWVAKKNNSHNKILEQCSFFLLSNQKSKSIIFVCQWKFVQKGKNSLLYTVDFFLISQREMTAIMSFPSPFCLKTMKRFYNSINEQIKKL